MRQRAIAIDRSTRAPRPPDQRRPSPGTSISRAGSRRRIDEAASTPPNDAPPTPPSRRSRSDRSAGPAPTDRARRPAREGRPAAPRARRGPRPRRRRWVVADPQVRSVEAEASVGPPDRARSLAEVVERRRRSRRARQRSARPTGGGPRGPMRLRRSCRPRPGRRSRPARGSPDTARGRSVRRPRPGTRTRGRGCATPSFRQR